MQYYVNYFRLEYLIILVAHITIVKKLICTPPAWQQFCLHSTLVVVSRANQLIKQKKRAMRNKILTVFYLSGIFVALYFTVVAKYNKIYLLSYYFILHITGFVGLHKQNWTHENFAMLHSFIKLCAPREGVLG